ncbi:hypothetical protein PLESTF_001417100 [Pleodorina starrii]|nr:hypothetical protein PLESTF_001417100 [Pleodorina starrii]
MYFAYGWPRVPFTNLPPNDTYIYLRATEKYLFAVSRTCVQLWTGGLYRIKLSECVRTEEDVKQEGLHIAALWSPAKATLAVLTSENHLHLYAIHLWKDNLLHSSCNVGHKDIQKADIYLKSSIRMDSETRALSITGDSRLLLVSFADGTVASLSWSGKMKEVAYPLDDATELGLPAGADGPLGEHAGGRPAADAGASSELDPHQSAAAGRSTGGGSSSAFAAAAAAASAAALPPGAAGGGAGMDFGGGGAAPPELSRAIVQMSYCEHSKQVVMVLADGACAVCGTSESGLSPLPEMCFGRWLCGPQQQAVCAQVSAQAQLIAVGRDNGDVELFRLYRTAIESQADVPGSPSSVAGAPWEPPVRTLSLDNWGHKSQQTGPVATVEWSPDGRALAVGYAGQGVVVWSPSGCRLMCSLRQPPPSLSTYPSAASRGLISQQVSFASRGLGWGLQHASSSGLGPQPQAPLDGAVSALCWGPMGYQLEVAEVGGGGGMPGTSGGLTEVTFAHSLPGNHRVARGGMGSSLADEEMHVLQAHDRLLLIREAGEVATGVMHWAAGDVVEPAVGQVGDLTVAHVPVPHSYVVANWPLQRSAMSASGTDIAVAGRNGLAVYNRPTERWRLFGDISQERQVSCRALGWLSSGVLVACSGPDPYASPSPLVPTAGGLVGGGGAGAATSGVTGSELLLLPRYHLDLTSLLARYPLQQPPIAMDCLGSHILLASEPLEITLLEVSLHGDLSPTGNPRATITSLREISMFDVGRHLSDVALVPLSPGAVGAAAAAAAAAAAGGGAVAASVAAPRQCVLLRWGGMLSVLDLEKGSELSLATEIEAFWLSDAITCQKGPFAGGFVETWAAGSAGWAPSAPSLAAAGPVPSGSASSGAVDSLAAGESAGPAPSQSVGLLGGSGAAPQPSSSSTTLDVEMPWWLYGPAGMQLCFPSSLGTSAASSMACKEGQDIELEFDQEVYPVGISLADDAIVGITQRIVRGSGAVLAGGGGPPMVSAAQLPCFHPIPESQPVLPCLLRRLLQRGAFQEAVSLARRHARGPHFARSLEWLLFTALELETNTSSLTRPAAAAGKRAPGPAVASDTGEGSGLARQPSMKQLQSLLAAAADLVRHFPNLFAEVVVSVARKTDAALWPPLFDAVGSPSKLLDGLVEAGELASAACFLLIIDRLEGASAAQEQALRLMRSSLLRGQYPLCCELLRFVVPPSDSDPDSGRLASPDAELPSTAEAPGSSEPSASAGTQEQRQPQPTQQEQEQQQQPREAASGAAAASGPASEKPSTSAPEGASQQAGDGGGGRTWLGWLLGYSADPVPDAGGGQGDQQHHQQQQGQQERSDAAKQPLEPEKLQQQQQQSAEPLPVAPDPDFAPAVVAPNSSAAAAAAAPGLSRSQHGRMGLPPNSPARVGGLAAAAPGSPALAQMLMAASASAASGSAANAANAKAACGLVAEHAWRLLENGHLAALGQLVEASSFLPGGLAGLMRQHRDSPYAARGCAAHSARELLQAVTRAVSELPVWTGEAVEMCAVAVEALCREVGAVAWAVAMAVVLVDAATVTAFRKEQPVEWGEFVQALHADTSLSYLWDIVGVLSEGVEAPDARAGEQSRRGGDREAEAEGAGTSAAREQQGEGGGADEAAGGYALSGKFAANVGHVELRSVTVAPTSSSEIEEVSQQSTPQAAAIPVPRAGAVSIARG